MYARPWGCVGKSEMGSVWVGGVREGEWRRRGGREGGWGGRLGEGREGMGGRQRAIAVWDNLALVISDA